MRNTMYMLAAAALLGVTTAAPAATLYLSDVTPSTSMKVTFPGIPLTTAPVVGLNQWTFDPNLAQNAGLAALIPGTTLTTLCIEGTQDVSLHANETFSGILTDPADAPQDNVGSLYKMGANASTLSKFWDAYYGMASLDDVHAAAFQLGVWEIVYDNGTDLAAGDFTAVADLGDPDSAPARALAQSWLAGLGSVNPSMHYDLYVLTDPRLQDQLFGIPAVPVPAALPAGLMVLAGWGAYRRLRKA